MSSRAWLLTAVLVGGCCMIGDASAQTAAATQTTPVAPAPAPATLISKFRSENNEGAVTSDPRLTAIAQDQASAMAAKDKLDHEVLGSFGSRVASSGSDRAAENIAYGHDNFPKTLDQWIASPSHRRNLLLKDASRIGVASAKTPAGRTYWAMVIAGYKADEPKVVPPRTFVKKSAPTRTRTVRRYRQQYARAAAPIRKREPECRVHVLGLCI